MIHGRVVDEDGEPLVGASVRLVTLKPRQRLLGETVTDSEGRFRLPGAAGKPYVILHGRARALYERLGGRRILVSISDTRELVMAQALLEG